MQQSECDLPLKVHVIMLLITCYISNSTLTPIDKSATISIIAPFLVHKGCIAIGTVMICDLTWNHSHAFSCHLGVNAFAIGKITLPIAHAIIPKSHLNPFDYPY